MKIIVAGAGAMGCRFGWQLYEAGNEILLVDRWEEHIEQIRAHGLEVIDDRGAHKSFIPISSVSESYGNPDLLIMLSKSVDTEEMITDCKHLIGSATRVLTLQNGLGNIQILRRHIPKDKIIAGVTTFATDLLGPGKIRILGTGETQMMQVDGKATKELEKIAKTLNYAGLNVVISGDVVKTIWVKLAFNSVYNAVCTLTDSTVADFWNYNDIENVVDALLDEIILVAQAENIGLDRDDISSLIKEAPMKGGHGNHYPSMWQDVSKGRRTEIEHLNGAIVQLADKHCIPVPNNRIVSHLIRMLENNRHRKVRQ